jgi:hypothetical protein
MPIGDCQERSCGSFQLGTSWHIRPVVVHSCFITESVVLCRFDVSAGACGAHSGLDGPAMRCTQLEAVGPHSHQAVHGKETVHGSMHVRRHVRCLASAWLHHGASLYHGKATSPSTTAQLLLSCVGRAADMCTVRICTSATQSFMPPVLVVN